MGNIMEHDLQKKQELELWNMVSSGKPRQGAKTPSRTPQRMKQEVPNRNYQTISRSKKTAQAVRRKKARKRRIRFYRLMAIIRIILCLIGAHTVADTIYGWVHKPPEKEEAVVQVVSLPAQNDEIAFEEHDITLMAVGDNLLHMGIVNAGKQSDGSRNYDFLFDGIGAFLEKADIKIINQETIFGGNELDFHGYPKFNSPTEAGDTIAGAGFNVVLQATNHTADQGMSGMENCIDFWKTHPEVLVTGIHEPLTEETYKNRIPLLKVGDDTFAILNYTYGANGESISSSIKDRMNMLCDVDESNGRIDFETLNKQVLLDISEAKTLADIVIVCPHWGTEYSTTPSSTQEKFAMQMTEAGADIIIGTHPHVVQPVKWIEATNGNRALCYYSLGNYVSTQKNGQSMLEGMAWITFHVTKDGISVSEDQTGIIPLVCHYTSNPTRFKQVYLLENYTEELASSHGIISYGGISFHLDDCLKWSDEILGDWVLSADEVLSP